MYDPVKKEVIRGAVCALSGPGGTRTTQTDGFGDFWFEGLDAGTYSLEISAQGFPTRTFGSIDTGEDVNLGDIPLG